MILHDTDISVLTPFHIDDADKFYNSTRTRSTRAFGYTYPELLDWEVNLTTLKYQVTSIVNFLYGGTTTGSKQRSNPERSADPMDSHYAINVVVNGYVITHFRCLTR